MRKLFAPLLSLFVLLSLSVASIAVNPDEVLDDPALEERARALSAEIRCLVCQNQSIDDSDAQLARDLRVLVREQLVAGQSDQQILDFLVERYGEFVLLKPRLNSGTLVLWAAPFAILLVAGGILFARSRKSVNVLQTAENLSNEERAELDKIIGSKE